MIKRIFNPYLYICLFSTFLVVVSPLFAVEDSNLTSNINIRPKVTLIEFGSNRCIPCVLMRPIIKELEKEYAGKITIIFYDIYTTKGELYSGYYNIRAIPTQIFLSSDGIEYFRHEGYFSKEGFINAIHYGLKL